MLVIRRRAGEIIVIGSNVELEVLEIGYTKVKLGIRAPREILVLRKEIQLTQDQNRAASNIVPLAAIDRLRARLQATDSTRAELKPTDPSH